MNDGFKLFRPWATEVVNGKMKFIVRLTNTLKRGRVAVIATKGIDGIWMENVDISEIEKIVNKVGIIGSVSINNSIEIKYNNVKNELIKLGGESYWKYYPKYLIPRSKKNIYIWEFKNPNEWDKPLNFLGGGILWSKINVNDRK